MVEPMPSEWVEQQVFSSWLEGRRWSWRSGDFRLELALTSLPDSSSLYSLTGPSVFLRLPQAQPRIKGGSSARGAHRVPRP